MARSHAAVVRRVRGLLPLVLVATSACARRPVMCARACDQGFACVAGECLRAGATPQIAALDRFGLYQARRLVVAPVEVVRLGPGDTKGVLPAVAILGRQRDAGSMLLLRFSVSLPPGTAIVEAHIVLDRATSVDADPAPVTLHAARILDPWDARSIGWGRAPRLDEARFPETSIDDARQTVRIDVRTLVGRWRLHAPDDQGIAIVADSSTPTGTAFAVADGRGSSDDTATVNAPSGPRLELCVRP